MNTAEQTRREFLKFMGLGMASLAAPQLPFFSKKSLKRPNVLVIHVDQHRIDCLGTYGCRSIKTPHIDSLADDGVRYVNSFCPYPVCTPSRYSLLCGQYVQEHCGWSNNSTLAPDIATFPRIMRAAGYRRTKAVGKMHFMPTYLDVGFDELVLSEQNGAGRWDDDYHRYLMDRGLVDWNDLEDQLRDYRSKARPEYWETFGALVSNLPEEHHATTWIGDRAMETLQLWDSGGGQLLMIGFIKPHHPFDPPAPWHEMYDPKQIDILPGWTEDNLDHDLEFNKGYFDNSKLSLPAVRLATAYYFATISQIDHHVGRMINLLKQKGLYEDTLIVFTSDHGEYLGFHHMLLKSNYLYDPLAKVPLIIKWPGNKRAGSVSQQMVSNIDIAPTLCRAAGILPGKRMHGNDLQRESVGHEIIFSESRNQVMARSRTRKLILTSTSKNLYFDLENDPLEMNNIYEEPQYRDERSQMEKILDEWRFKEKIEPYRDENAPQINQPNVPSRDFSHRPEIIQYYREKMKVLQGG
ncbi:MAG: sulfatase-like hydrolase/transferase [Fidelibacterota bacterium]|nr:MAG: sulfatase-like hydrolase/transferase [Candidatus Neomarinimicrobiota bacterium]